MNLVIPENIIFDSREEYSRIEKRLKELNITDLDVYDILSEFFKAIKNERDSSINVCSIIDSVIQTYMEISDLIDSYETGINHDEQFWFIANQLNQLFDEVLMVLLMKIKIKGLYLNGIIPYSVCGMNQDRSIVLVRDF